MTTDEFLRSLRGDALTDPTGNGSGNGSQFIHPMGGGVTEEIAPSVRPDFLYLDTGERPATAQTAPAARAGPGPGPGPGDPGGRAGGVPGPPGPRRPRAPPRTPARRSPTLVNPGGRPLGTGHARTGTGIRRPLGIDPRRLQWPRTGRPKAPGRKPRRTAFVTAGAVGLVAVATALARSFAFAATRGPDQPRSSDPRSVGEGGQATGRAVDPRHPPGVEPADGFLVGGHRPARHACPAGRHSDDERPAR